MSQKKILCLFDMDGTLTKARGVISSKFYDFLLTTVKPRSCLALVGGSDFKKIAEQMGGADVVHKFDYVFAENGLIAFKFGKELGRQSIQEFVGEDVLQKFINYVLRYLSTITLPVKRGTFVEFRVSMLNISPIGRSCSQEERDAFERYDNEHQIRKTMIENLKKQFPDIRFTYSIGGQISFDVFPKGWDKTYCLQHLEKEGFDEIHFFGDKTDKGGNDYEIYIENRVIGHKVNNPEDTKKQLEEILKIKSV
ncbi:hypothetical protein NQ317_006946 [Molorchus minor]|uniref:Phosphomannomutase n=1 Tax=Molorchus minor TaxID=1323400 RepID=A0ABQ9JN27_9CUCU|nr:hypothetical protein NQ317_006946 [Molorchus minor]